jgi:hypothetical protein
MLPENLGWARRLSLALGVLGVGLTVACSAPSEPTSAAGPSLPTSVETSTPEPGGTTGRPPSTNPATDLAKVPSAHVHGLARDPGSGNVVVATHEGLYVYEGPNPKRVGPVIDLMGFTVAGAGHYYASGHPGTGTDLPSPVGLIESRDGGKTWAVLSRGGQSDFHALTTAGQSVVGFDGVVRATADGRTWAEGNLDSPPRTLAGPREGSTVLATTQEGLMRSTDGGVTWDRVARAPLLLLAAFGDGESVVGLTPEGQVYTSSDDGQRWQATELSAPGAEALHVSGEGNDMEILVSSGRTLLASTGGQPFEPLR